MTHAVPDVAELDGFIDPSIPKDFTHGTSFGDRRLSLPILNE